MVIFWRISVICSWIQFICTSRNTSSTRQGGGAMRVLLPLLAEVVYQQHDCYLSSVLLMDTSRFISESALWLCNKLQQVKSVLYFLPPSSGSSENSTVNDFIYTLTDISPALSSCFVRSVEQHRGASWAGLRRINLLPRRVLLQERRHHSLRPRHLARVRGAGCGRALLRHLEIPLQGPQRRHPPPVVTTAGAGRRFSTFLLLCARAKVPCTPTPSTAHWSCDDSQKVYENTDRELFTVF